MIKKHNTLTLMCGLARSGKSTWIKKNKGEAVVVCPDIIRSKIFGHQFHKDAEGFIWAVAQSMVKLLLDQGKDVIIDATNLTYSSRKDWIDIAKIYNSNVRIVWIKTSLFNCIKRNSSSPEGSKLPEDVLIGMANVFQDPVYRKEYNIELVQYPKKLYKSYNSGSESSFALNYYKYFTLNYYE